MGSRRSKSNLLCLIDVKRDSEPRSAFGPAAFLGRSLAGSHRFVNNKVFQLCARLQLLPQPSGLRMFRRSRATPAAACRHRWKIDTNVTAPQIAVSPYVRSCTARRYRAAEGINLLVLQSPVVELGSRGRERGCRKVAPAFANIRPQKS